eukprot:s3521_g12.t1
MPWRSRVGEPFGRNSDQFSSEFLQEDTGLQDWDTDLVDDENLFGDPDEAIDLEAAAVGSFHESLEHDHGMQVEVVSAGSDCQHDKKRPAESSSLQTGAGIDDRLFFSMLKVPRTGALRQPWETGMFAAVFKRPTQVLKMPWMSLPNVGRQESFQGITPAVDTAARTPFHHKRLLAVRLAQTDDQLRAKALRRLRDLILVAPSHTQLGRALMDSSGQLTGEDRISSVFADAFRSRATSTLVKRSLDFYKMAIWIESHLNLLPMQLSEGVVYQYLSYLREAEAAPTSADATVKAIWFMHSTAVIIDFNPGSFTSRISGVCRDMYMKKRVLKQAPAFPVSVVKSLEEYALMCGNKEVYLVEAATSEAKNTNTMERRRMLLPFSAVGWGVHPNPWCIKWKMQLESFKHATIMPAFSEVSGQFLGRRLTTSEANLWLKEVLVRGGLSAGQAARYSTHSCKATVPTWASKFGGFSMDERRMLTHHMDGNSMMPLTYSRDNLTALHSRIFRMLAAIRNGEFTPDESNAARIFRDNKDLFQDAGHDEAWTEDWAASESDVSGDLPGRMPHFVGCHQTPADEVAGNKLLHHESLVVHIIRDEATLWCGRKLSRNYRAWQQGDPDFAQLLVCQQCDKSQPR